MYFAIPKLAVIAIVLSCYNIFTWTIDWFRFSIGWFGPSFWALLPQIAVTIWLYLMVRKYERFNYRVAAPFATLTLWLSIIVIGSADLFFSKVQNPWPMPYSALEAVGFPILQIEYGGAAPFLGFFHNNQGDQEVATGWYFDGGVLFSWFAFNAVMLLLFIALSRIAFEDLREGRKGDE